MKLGKHYQKVTRKVAKCYLGKVVETERWWRHGGMTDDVCKSATANRWINEWINDVAIQICKYANMQMSRAGPEPMHTALPLLSFVMSRHSSTSHAIVISCLLSKHSLNQLTISLTIKSNPIPPSSSSSPPPLTHPFALMAAILGTWIQSSNSID